MSSIAFDSLKANSLVHLYCLTSILASHSFSTQMRANRMSALLCHRSRDESFKENVIAYIYKSQLVNEQTEIMRDEERTFALGAFC